MSGGGGGGGGSSSFVKKKPSKTRIPAGCKASLHNGQLLVSTGIASVDALLGAGRRGGWYRDHGVMTARATRDRRRRPGRHAASCRFVPRCAAPSPSRSLP